VARYNSEAHRIEMWLRSSQDQTLDIPDLNLSVQLKKDEEIRTELSTKYDRPLAEKLLSLSGFELVKWYTDPDQLISLALARKP
jgi:L-histidine N-alpha-methyltransferase